MWRNWRSTSATKAASGAKSVAEIKEERELLKGLMEEQPRKQKEKEMPAVIDQKKKTKTKRAIEWIQDGATRENEWLRM